MNTLPAVFLWSVHRSAPYRTLLISFEWLERLTSGRQLSATCSLLPCTRPHRLRLGDRLLANTIGTDWWSVSRAPCVVGSALPTWSDSKTSHRTRMCCCAR